MSVPHMNRSVTYSQFYPPVPAHAEFAQLFVVVSSVISGHGWHSGPLAPRQTVAIAWGHHSLHSSPVLCCFAAKNTNKTPNVQFKLRDWTVLQQNKPIIESFCFVVSIMSLFWSDFFLWMPFFFLPAVTPGFLLLAELDLTSSYWNSSSRSHTLTKPPSSCWAGGKCWPVGDASTSLFMAAVHKTLTQVLPLFDNKQVCNQS